jgi:hypothetical protein
VVDPGIDTVDHQVDPLAHLVAGQSLANDPADHLLTAGAAAMNGVPVDAAKLGDAVVGQRLVHRLNDVIAPAKLLQDFLRAAGDEPAPGLDLDGQAEAFQPLGAADQEVPILADEVALALAGPEVDDAVLTSLRHQHPVKPGDPLGLHFAGELAAQFQFTLMPELARDQLARPVAYPVGDIVARDVENLAVVGHAAHDDVRVRMAGVVMVDRDPVEAGAEVLLHLPHEVTREATQVAQVSGILGGDDEAELVAVVPAARQEGAALSPVLQGRVGVALLAIPGDPVAFQIAQVGAGCLAGLAGHLGATRLTLRVELDDSRLDDHPPNSEPARGVPLPPASILGE